MPNHTS